jgi:hypothetical protein
MFLSLSRKASLYGCSLAAGEGPIRRKEKPPEGGLMNGISIIAC